MTQKTLSSYTAAYEYRYGSMLYNVDTNFLNESDVTFEYGGDGKRRARTSGGVTTGYNWNGLNIINEEDDTGDLERTYIGRTLAHVDGASAASGTYQYYLDDHLGSLRQLRAQNKSLVGTYDFSPYGNALAWTGPSPARGFTSHTWDKQAGLYMAPARAYSPGMGRWISREPLGLDGPNLYHYGLGSPIVFLDPNGLWGIQFGENGYNIGVGDPTFLFTNDTWGDLGEGAAATADGLLDAATFNGAFGLFDPGVFGRLGAYDDCDPILRTSRVLGGVSGALLLAGTGPRGPLFGRAGHWGRGKGVRPGFFNRGDRLRIGWSWNNASGRNWFSIHGGGRGAGPHWHWDLLPGPGKPTSWW